MSLIEKNGYCLSYPYQWQRPAKTEEWAYEAFLIHSVPQLYSFTQFFFFPWATLIDFINKGELCRGEALGDVLKDPPPKSTLLRATVCQHISAMQLLPVFKRLKITDVFWSHAVLGEEIIDGIRVHPFPLYPVQAFNSSEGGGAPSEEREWLYSFIGAYESGLYLTDVRKWIFGLCGRDGAYIKERKKWHFEDCVYNQQVHGESVSHDSLRRKERQELEYARVLRQSVFSLCPSGSGPNSIRLWESLGLGAIPVIMSDSLRLPGHRFEWEQACVFVGESEDEVKALPDLLKNIAEDKEELYFRQEACRRLWVKFCLNGPSCLLGELNNASYVYSLVKGSGLGGKVWG